MVVLVKNPQTNRYIRVNGPVFCQLEKKGISVPLNDVRSVSKPFKPVLDKTAPKSKVNSKFGVDRSNVSWAEKKPSSTVERQKLLDRCGKDCFLIPEAKKFPICNKIEKKNDSCVYNCKGLKAASSRAGEWKYKNVLENSKALTSNLDCYTSKARPMNSFFQKLQSARKKEQKSFMYKGDVYKRKLSKTGLVVYCKSKK